MAILTTLAFLALALGLGWLPVRRLAVGTEPPPLLAPLAAVVVGGLLLYFVVWAVGSLEYSLRSMSGVVAAAALFGLPGLRAAWCDLRPRLAAWRPPTGPALIWGIGSLVLVAGMVLGALAPPADTDAIRYHLLLPSRDLGLGHMATVPGWSMFDYFPQMMEFLYRLALPFSGFEGAQMIHVACAVLAALATYAFAVRLGASPAVASLATMFFLALRMVMYQSATGDIDLGMTAAFAILLLAALAWDERPTLGLAVLLGALGGAVLNIKYTGGILIVTLGLALLVVRRLDRQRLTGLVLMAAVALACLMPVLVRNTLAVGNPVFPLYHHLFGAENIDLLAGTTDHYRQGLGVVDFLLLPVTVFLFPAKFDGLQVGTPYLLAFLPLAFAAVRWRDLRLMGICTVLYGTAWYWLMPVQVRFLLPVLPVVAALGALGAAESWRLVRPFRPARWAFLGIALAMTATQGMFFTGTAIRRWPVALGLVPDSAYLNSPPYIYTHWPGCRYVADRLDGDGRWLGLNRYNSLYCPQARMAVQLLPGDLERLHTRQGLRPATLDDALAFLTENRVRFIIAEDTPDGRPWTPTPFERYDMVRDRFNDVLWPALTATPPLMADGVSRVWSAEDVIAALRAGR